MDRKISKPALVICCEIYTYEESNRRMEEDRVMWGVFSKVEEAVDGWINTNIGKARLTQTINKNHAESTKVQVWQVA